jgi:polar amino acid transport system permease protein
MTTSDERAQPGLVAPDASSPEFKSESRDFPWWLVAIGAILGWMIFKIIADDRYHRAFQRVAPGWWLTVKATGLGFLIALVIGLLAGLGRISRNALLRNISLTYIEFIRGVPILVLIFTISYVVVPQMSTAFGFDNSSVDFFWRAVSALAIIYGAYLAEVFRAGIESVPPGQMEAGRSVGMSRPQAMRLIVLPQAVRNMTPAIGNDLIGMLKDSSLLSVLGVRELSQYGKLYASSSFQFRPTYVVLTMFYLSMTLVLSLLLRWYRKRLGLDGD